MNWDDTTRDRLRQLWDEGLSCRLIGLELGCTKSCVAGMARRLSLPMRYTGIPRKVVRGTSPRPAPVFGKETCRWPLGETLPFTPCGAPALAGKPYCQDHARKAYVRPPSSVRPLAL